jgi:7-cyano-7-deazaguanine tRNA-ribosyltransferase
LPLSVALGCDTFDSASYALFARQGRYMTERGTLILEEMTYLPCSCPACNSTTRTDLVQMERWDRVNKLSLHNLYLLRQDVLRCREAISEGRLWDLVEERAAAHPRAMSALREMAKHGDWLSGGTPFLKERGLLMRSKVDEARPEIAVARAHLAPLMKRRSKGAVLVLGEGDRPLSKGPLQHRLVRLTNGGATDVYKLHPQLGPYPAELEFVYPFTQTVSDDEASDRNVRDAVEKLRAMGYTSVVLVGRGRTRTLKGRNQE